MSFHILSESRVLIFTGNTVEIYAIPPLSEEPLPAELYQGDKTAPVWSSNCFTYGHYSISRPYEFCGKLCFMLHNKSSVFALVFDQIDDKPAHQVKLFKYTFHSWATSLTMSPRRAFCFHKGKYSTTMSISWRPYPCDEMIAPKWSGTRRDHPTIWPVYPIVMDEEVGRVALKAKNSVILDFAAIYR
ncbi:hypothetical protein BDN72DRAFT_848138 [Pluteus cervinus]|uniref:Uncharacterized protein n=1 Tax=Pluteus cervinus TaxID=181527 RepID=A0ACD3ABB0_9AGAR|nr:hypothetical protein BDN72DRAFT_848138 [Pluteus cervinus]